MICAARLYMHIYIFSLNSDLAQSTKNERSAKKKRFEEAFSSIYVKTKTGG